MEGGPQPLHVVIRRSHLLEDALDGLGPPGVSIRGPISATFINAQGIEVRAMLGRLPDSAKKLEISGAASAAHAVLFPTPYACFKKYLICFAFVFISPGERH